jgi:hypothetical protein
MQYPRRALFSDDILPDDSLLCDELDELFSRLEQLQPPPSLIARILSTISQLPQLEQRTAWGEWGNLIVRREDYPPC